MYRIIISHNYGFIKKNNKKKGLVHKTHILILNGLGLGLLQLGSVSQPNSNLSNVFSLPSDASSVRPMYSTHPDCICGSTVDKSGTRSRYKDTLVSRYSPQVPVMASTAFSLSLATFSSPTALFSNTKTFIAGPKSHERTLSSSFLATRTSFCQTLRSRPMSLRKGSRGVTCSAPSALPSALLFDCDGVLVDTEKDGHRISFNDTFKERELGVIWDVDLYGELLKIGGGKERMTAYFNKTGWPEKSPKGEEERKEFIASLHKRKTELFMALIEKKLLPLRPGVGKLIDQALQKGVKVAVCSTSNEKAVSAIVSCLLGPQRAEKIKIFAGDVVPRKKPDPAIYVLAASTLGVDPSSCVVVEDSAIGLAAAKAAGMKCIVTKSGYTADEDFLNADAVFDCIGDPPEERFDLSFCGSLLEKQYVS